jgi:glycosyltransferase involved in cell wall biosynthesis
MIEHGKSPCLSVVVVFFNMRREAERTLYSLTTAYQQGVSETDYEVIAVDSGSTEPLNKSWVESLQGNFGYYYIEPEHPAPCRAMNFGIARSRADKVVCAIDGARMLSPNMLSFMLRANALFEHPFVYTLAMHIGHELQNIAVTHGYNQAVEDALLASVDWREDGYRLYDISCLAASSKHGYAGLPDESNFFSVEKNVLQALGGFDERFKTPGGGLVNLDVFSRLFLHPGLEPVMLLGEATFHQFHGGVATNIPLSQHPWKVFAEEYRAIRGTDFKFITPERLPYYFGKIPPNARHLLVID